MSFLDSVLPPSIINSTEEFTVGDVVTSFVNQFGLLKDLAVPLTLLFAVFSQLGLGLNSLQGIWQRFFSSCCSTLTIDEYETAYDQLYEWTSEQKFSKSLRHLRFVSEDFDTGKNGPPASLVSEFSLDEIFNYQNWEAMIEPRFEPERSTNWFRHNGYWFMISRTTDKQNMPVWRDSPRERVEIKVLWWSTKPIQDLLRDVRRHHYTKQTSTTVIRRPVGQGSSSSHFTWRRVSERPSRPMNTVALDDEQKRAMLEDVNSFLHPRHQQWYSNRGIPYRRGYLLHGPPGTGKSSMSFALAGLFGLDVYCLSLSDPSLSETNLIQLFNSLPRRCLVLLEDVDSAGLGRRQQEALKLESKQSKPDTKKSTKKHRKSKSQDKLKGITLSGLLNAIDGVAAAEGRLLVMTTNHPETLDDALVRPGRVDMQIEFGLATTTQIRQIFLRMYSADETPEIRQPRTIAEALAQPQSKTDSRISSTTTDNKTAPLDGIDDLETLAEKFASRVPSGVFSPAAIQGFLIGRRKSALQAVLDAEEWVIKEQNKRVEGNAENDKREKRISEIVPLGEMHVGGSTSASDNDNDSGSDSEASGAGSDGSGSGSDASGIDSDDD